MREKSWIGGAVLAVAAAWFAVPGRPAERPASEGLETHLRRPVALALASDGRRLFVANRTGSVSVLDTRGRRVISEAVLGGAIVDLAGTPDGTHLLAIDEKRGELLVLRAGDQTLAVVHRLAVGGTPVGVSVSADGKRATVASLWPRRLTVFDLSPLPNRLRPTHTISLPFAPRRLLALPGTPRVIVADAFGGRLAVVDTVKGKVESVRTLPGHNLRGLALSRDGRRLLLTQQILNPLAQTSQDDIHWGNLITNDLRILDLASVLGDGDLLRGSELVPLGEAGHGTGDPAGVAVSVRGTVAVALAGTAEVAVARELGASWEYVHVGRGPTALAADPDGRHLYVADTFGDSISIVDLTSRQAEEVRLGPTPEPEARDRGEALFHDARLSHNGWLSCQSCHPDGHTNGQKADTLADGSYGTPKRVLSLRGVGDTDPWAWNGTMHDLETQVRQSIEVSMRGAMPAEQTVRDLEAFLRSLPPPPPLMPADAAAVRRGKELFAGLACHRCHNPPTFTSPSTYDVGLADEAGLHKFNPPSLRGVSQGGPYFHDGRAARLEDVFARHHHQLKRPLDKTELADLVRYLVSL